MCRGGSPSRRSPVISRENSRARTPGRDLFRAEPIGTNHIPPKAVRTMGEKVICKLGHDLLWGNGFGIGVLRPNLISKPFREKSNK